MTTREAPLVRTELALILVALALLAPRLAGSSPGVLNSALPAEAARAAVGYAQHRLWSDFLSDRRQWAQGRSIPAPTLEEYRLFLSGLGLKRRGDRASLLVLPKLDPERIPDQIEVKLECVHPPIVLKLYVRDTEDRPRCAGQLEFRVDTENVVTCWAETDKESKLLTFWPVRPGPLLP